MVSWEFPISVNDSGRGIETSTKKCSLYNGIERRDWKKSVWPSQIVYKLLILHISLKDLSQKIKSNQWHAGTKLFFAW